MQTTLRGGWVQYRDPEDVPERLRRRVVQIGSQLASIGERAEAGDISPEDMTLVSEMNDAIAICLVVAWSWDAPLSVEGLQDLPVAAYDEIVKHGQAHVERLLPNFGVNPDPKVPTAN